MALLVRFVNIVLQNKNQHLYNIKTGEKKMKTIPDKMLDYLDYMTNRHGSKFVIISSLILLIVLLIDIFKRLI